MDIQIPAMDQIIDFELDEDVRTDALLEDILILLAEREHISCPNSGIMRLYGVEQEAVLKKGESLRQQGVRTGDRLILI